MMGCTSSHTRPTGEGGEGKRGAGGARAGRGVRVGYEEVMYSWGAPPLGEGQTAGPGTGGVGALAAKQNLLRRTPRPRHLPPAPRAVFDRIRPRGSARPGLPSPPPSSFGATHACAHHARTLTHPPHRWDGGMSPSPLPVRAHRPPSPSGTTAGSALASKCRSRPPPRSLLRQTCAPHRTWRVRRAAKYLS
jgi:hypothetical protein